MYTYTVHVQLVKISSVDYTKVIFIDFNIEILLYMILWDRLEKDAWDFPLHFFENFHKFRIFYKNLKINFRLIAIQREDFYEWEHQKLEFTGGPYSSAS